VIVKGYRNDVDLEYERLQAEYNLANGGYKTELILASEEYGVISSTLARDLIKRGADLNGVLPEKVISFIKEN
jgi:phosphopantetheine adenylyltransferase